MPRNRSHSCSTLIVLVLVIAKWPLISSLRLLMAPAVPETSAWTPSFAAAKNSSTDQIEHQHSADQQTDTSSSPANKPNVVLLNGGAFLDTILYNNQQPARHPTAAAAAAAPPPPPEPPPTNSGNSNSRAHDTPQQSSGISREGMLIMILIFMLLIVIPLGFALDDPTRSLLKATKAYGNKLVQGLTGCICTMWGTFLAYCAIAVVCAATTVHCAVLAANTVVMTPVVRGASCLKSAAAAALWCCLAVVKTRSSRRSKQHMQQEADVQTLPAVPTAGSCVASSAAATNAAATMMRGDEVNTQEGTDVISARLPKCVIVEMGQVAGSKSSCCFAGDSSDSGTRCCTECKDTPKERSEKNPAGSADKCQTDHEGSELVAGCQLPGECWSAATAPPEGVMEASSSGGDELYHTADETVVNYNTDRC